MTLPDEFHANILKILNYLDEILPPGKRNSIE